MLIVMNCQMFWPKSRDFVSLSLRTCHKFILTMGLSDLGFSSVVIWYKAWLMTYTQVGVLCGLNQMLIPGRERMCRLDSERC